MDEEASADQLHAMMVFKLDLYSREALDTLALGIGLIKLSIFYEQGKLKWHVCRISKC